MMGSKVNSILVFNALPEYAIIVSSKTREVAMIALI
jgi:hypothetical protein